jgi:hypothetical protein
MQQFIAVLWYIAMVVSFISCLWAMFHSFIAIGVIVGLVDIVLSLVCWKLAKKRARRRRARPAYVVRRYPHAESEVR